MSDKPSNYELDDELLSAYLDGELAADERAAVEARLATDPAAQQLLHELQSVSQSVQALPIETLGRDLSEEILSRAREAKPVHGAVASLKATAADERSRPADTLPKIRIFNSRRAWIWASMAMAAGLLVMIVQSGDEPAKKLPSVAARNREGAQVQPAAESGEPARREVAISAAPESPSPRPSTVALDNEVREKVDSLGVMPAAPVSGEAGGGQLRSTTRDGAAAGPPVAAASPATKLRIEELKPALDAGDASSISTASPGQMATDKLTPALQPTGRVGGGAGGARGVAAGKQKSESLVDPNTQWFTVVRVVAKPEALNRGSFERLLADHKIEFVSHPAKNQPLSFGGGKLRKPVQSDSESKEQSKVSQIHAAKTEMVLVEAPAPAIESCLADLNKNSNDFLSIAVSEEPLSQDRVDAKSKLIKKLAENETSLSRFNRGAAPIAHDDTIDLYHYYYDFDKQTDRAANGSQPVGGFAGESSPLSVAPRDASSDEKSKSKDQSRPDIRRARRIETLDVADRQASEPPSASRRAARTQAGTELAKQPMSQRTLNDGTEFKADKNINQKVLFVFTTDETPAPSAPAANPPK